VWELEPVGHWVIISIFVDGENKKQIPPGNRIGFHAVLVVFGSDSGILQLCA
jgi:hypothetical protein